MSILSWLRGAKPASVKIETTRSGNLTIITIGAQQFYGQSSVSPDGRYTLAWCDANDEGTRGGARREGKGRYLLIDKDQLIVEGRMERPNDGHVANNGVFVLNDWRFSSDQLRGSFYAFRSDGTQILCSKFLANLDNCGVSRDGRFACCQTCHAPSERDGSVLTIFDLDKSVEVARWRPESGWANAYEFSADGNHVSLVYKCGPQLRYTLSGEFLDRELWVQSSLDRGDLYMLQKVINETHPKPEGEFARRLVVCADNGLAGLRADDFRTRALGLKLKAICLDGLEDWEHALKAYEEALALDSKIGVKRRAEQLRKKLA